MTRPAAHVDRDRYLALFHSAGLVPVVSTNGGIPDADIQLAKVPGNEAHSKAELEGAIECWVTERGQARLEEAAK